MPSFDNLAKGIAGFRKSFTGNPGKYLVPLGAIGIGGVAGVKTWNNHPEEKFQDRLGHSVGRASVGLLYGGAGLAVGSKIFSGVGAPAIRNAMNTPLNETAVAKSFSKAFSAKSVDDVKQLLGKSKALHIGLGAAVGGFVANKVSDGDPTKTALGAGAGAITGAIARPAIKSAKLWSKMGPIGRGVAIVAGTVGLAAGGRAMSQPNYKQEDTASSDGLGSYQVNTGVRERMNTLNASGDIVLGLHKKR